MKTFSKVLSMILVGVMCFGLFAGSAFAAEFSFSDGGDSAGFAQSSDFGGDSGFSFDGDSGFSFDAGSSSVAGSSSNDNAGSEFAFGDAPAAQPAGDSFDFKGDAEQQDKSKDGETEFVFGSGVSDKETFASPAPANVTYNDFSQNKTVIRKTDTDADATVEIKGTFGLAGDSFPAGYAYSTSSTGANLVNMSAGQNYDMGTDKMILRGSWLKTLTPNTYFFYGLRRDDVPVKMAYVTVNAGDYSDSSKYAFSASPATYTKYKDNSMAIAVTGVGISQMKRFGVASITGSYTHILAVSEYSLAGNTVTLSKTYLDSMPDDTYYFIGFPNASDTSEYVKSTNTFIVKTSEDNGSLNPYTGQNWYLEPSYSYAWTSGDDYLMFWSDLMNLRRFPNQYTVILRYGYGAGSIPTKEVNYNQFWDFDNGNFALGTNFLNSLPSGTYTLQVVEMKYGMCTNTVTFRIGAKLVPIDSDKHVINSIRNLRFLCDDPVAQVYVGNIPLEYGVDYALSANGKTITLSYEFLNKRSAGNTYTLKALTSYGDYCSTTFQILTTAQGGASPRTGDESNLGLWAAFLLLSGTAVVVLIPKLRKHDI